MPVGHGRSTTGESTAAGRQSGPVQPPDYDWTPEPLPEPWFILPDVLRADYEAELHREVGEGHPLWQQVLIAVAKCGHCDSVVFSVEGRYVQWAVVHLTWSGGQEEKPWPRASLHGTLAAAVAAHVIG